MSALVDTSVLVQGGTVDDLTEEWAVSVVTVGELEAGVLLARGDPERAARLRRLTGVLVEAPAIAIDRRVAARYGELRAASGHRPSNDLWIAATARAHGLTLITRDREQAALPGVATRLVG